MTDLHSSPAPSSPSPEQRRQATLHFERGNQLVATGDCKGGVRLLLECTRLDPANLLYRQALRRADKARFGSHVPKPWLARLLSLPLRARLRRAQRAGLYIEALYLGERILTRNPWDVEIHLEMAAAAEHLGLLDLAVWSLEQARHSDPNNPEVNRRLARLYERRGNFTQSLDLWDRVRQVAPHDEEASRKLADAPVRPSPLPSHRSPPDPQQREIAELHHRLAADPTLSTTYRDLARLFRQAGRIEQAHAVLLDGLAATGNAFELTVELAELQIEPFRQDLAVTEQKLAVTPGDELRRIHAELRREINSRELDLFRLLADRYPAVSTYRYEVGLRLMAAGQFEEARAAFTRVLGDPALRGLALLATGQCLRVMRNPASARDALEEALGALPEESGRQRLDLLYELSRCHADLGEWDRALDIACDVIRLDPEHRDIARLMEDWRSPSSHAPVA